MSRNMIVDLDLQNEEVEIDLLKHNDNGLSIVIKNEKCEYALILNEEQYKILKEKL
jgi:hypothetical protein